MKLLLWEARILEVGINFPASFKILIVGITKSHLVTDVFFCYNNNILNSLILLVIHLSIIETTHFHI
jgi:hypothetical protein